MSFDLSGTVFNTAGAVANYKEGNILGAVQSGIRAAQASGIPGVTEVGNFAQGISHKVGQVRDFAEQANGIYKLAVA